MNKMTIIGNLTRDPEKHTTDAGVNRCQFTVAVNKKRAKEGEQKADYIRVTAWRGLGDTCGMYLRKGRKVCVIGEARATCWVSRDGGPRCQLEITAEDVEFLGGGRSDSGDKDGPPDPEDPESGMTVADEEAPF